MSLRKQTLSGVKWTSFSSFAITLIQLLQLAVVARYLGPSEFGLMAMAWVVIGFSEMFADMGISGAIIHEQKITHTQLSSLYWLNIASGIVVFLIIFLLAPYVADFYKEPELIPLIRLLSFSFVIMSFSTQFRVLFQKELQFDLMAKVNIGAALMAFFAAVFSVMHGYGVYALVYAVLAATTFRSVIYLYYGLKIHKPTLTYRHNEITKMIRFGLYRMGSMNLNYFNSQFDVILIGKLLGAEALGIYSIAKNLSMRPSGVINPIVTSITFPVLAKVQDDDEKFKNIYLKTINYLSSVNFPIYILIAVLAKPIVLLLFGEKWVDSIIILQILSIYAMIRSTGNPVGFLAMAKGKTNMEFWWNMGLFFFMPLTIYIGSYGGLVGVAYSLLALMVILSVPNWYFLVHPLCGAAFKEYFWQIIKPLFIAVTVGVITYMTVQLFDLENMILKVLAASVVWGVATILLNLWYNHDFVSTILEMIGRKRKRA